MSSILGFIVKWKSWYRVLRRRKEFGLFHSERALECLKDYEKVRNRR
jgi:hypothetical protein